jgi:YtkA-like
VRIPLVLLLATAACSSGSDSSSTPSFPMSLTSDSGALHITIDASPNPPPVGTDAFVLTVTNTSDGTPRDDMTIAVVPWMPSMGHGTATPTVTARGNGQYRLSDVYLFMPGTWEFETTFSGPLDDHATPTFQVQ